MLLFFYFVCVICFVFSLVLVLYCKGPVHLVIGNCFSWKTCILIRAGESCMLSRGHSAQKTCFQEDGGEEY